MEGMGTIMNKRSRAALAIGALFTVFESGLAAFGTASPALAASEAEVRAIQYRMCTQHCTRMLVICNMGPSPNKRTNPYEKSCGAKNLVCQRGCEIYRIR